MEEKYIDEGQRPVVPSPTEVPKSKTKEPVEGKKKGEDKK